MTVRPTNNTGLAAADVYYFGNAPGDAGNSLTDARVNGADEQAARNNPCGPSNLAPVTFRYDYNRDGLVNAWDQMVARDGATTLSSERTED